MRNGMSILGSGASRAAREATLGMDKIVLHIHDNQHRLTDL